jgi:hypothetical protein
LEGALTILLEMKTMDETIKSDSGFTLTDKATVCTIAVRESWNEHDGCSPSLVEKGVVALDAYREAMK